MKLIENLANAVKNWWILLIIGILSVGCGIAVLAQPGAGIQVIKVFLIISLIGTGIFGIAYVLSNKDNIPAWGWDLVLPVLTVIAGIILACNKGAGEIFIICFFAAGVLCKAIETICYSIALSKVEGSGWGWTLALGIIELLLGIFLMANPLFTAIFASSLANVLVGITLLFMGIAAIATSIQLSKVKSAVKNAEKAVDEAAEQIKKTVEEMKEK